MKFEEVIPGLREGKKFRIKGYDDNGEYWIAGYLTLDGDSGNSENFPTLHRINKNGHAISDRNSWGVPRWAILSEEWEIVNEESKN